MPLDLIQAVILGAVQGLAEWLPISSKSQVVLVAGALGIAPEEALSYALFMHIGTLLAALVYFRREIARMITGSGLGVQRNYLVLSTGFTGLIGLPLFLLFRKSFDFSNGALFVALIGVGLVATGLILLWSRGTAGVRREGEAGLKDAALVGMAQGLSVLPGVSRSGTTTAALLWRGFSQEDALRLSFMMSIPTVAAAEVGFSLIEGLPSVGLTEACVMLAVAFIAGIASISALMAVARRINFGMFCIALGLLALIPFALGL
ncbi:MAG: undecaprenyl-diphosphate phosphatase [Candidatus Burarchaeum sp.]|nr:undecaprenyl-diphosphate phosphatase [Candidatus Burarchaeum sp.]MDO8339657.1 undecaprenyl-diphosphate phosphatase [Candidatus Burarchaeum sp.]